MCSTGSPDPDEPFANSKPAPRGLPSYDSSDAENGQAQAAPRSCGVHGDVRSSTRAAACAGAEDEIVVSEQAAAFLVRQHAAVVIEIIESGEGDGGHE
jgi:hypothetical protein